ncbi:MULTISPECIES: polysaccharide biosynthesis/export family protein [Barnesiella]|jgi:polysaccharide export protein, bexD/ctrA/vexA family|nr:MULTISPECIES: polysaccharide biosynthesis/export family protein [Barnesiella]
MKYIPKILLAVILVGLVSCVPSKKMVYLQGADGLEQSPQTIVQDYELKIVPDDQLLITVSSKNGELLEIFSNSQVLGSTGASTTIQETVGLRVDKDGKIEVPILGEMQAGGLSRRELADAVENKLIEGEYVKDPVVNVQIKGFKVSVMGEVNSPGVQTISGDRITLLEALTMAGDLTPSGKRDNILVIREDGDQRKTYTVDLTSGEKVLESPCYYLKQNDVIYVQPNKSIGVKGSSTLSFISAGSSIISLVASVLSIVSMIIVLKDK